MFQMLLKSILFFLSLSGLLNATTGLDKPLQINVGIYAPFSNKEAFIGRNILGAMEMARAALKTSSVHYSFYTLDKLPLDRNPTNTVQKFLQVHQIKVLVTEGSVNGLLLSSLAKKNNIIHFSMASDPAIADGKNNFLMWSPASEQASVLIKALKEKNIHTLGVITTNHPSDRVLTQTVLDKLQQNAAIKIIAYEQYPVGTTDFSLLIENIKDKNPDLYFIMASPKEIELIQAKMKAAQINKPITSIVERVTPKVMKVFDGQWYIDTHDMKAEFINQYQQEYFSYPSTEAGYAFDLFHILNQSVLMAMKGNSNFSTQDLATQIHFLAAGKGVMGPFNWDKKGILYTQSEVKQIKNGQLAVA